MPEPSSELVFTVWLLLTSCVTLSELLKLSGPLFLLICTQKYLLHGVDIEDC